MKILKPFASLAICLLIFTPKSNSQEKDFDPIFTKVQVPPAFPGGPDAWINFLLSTIDKAAAVKRGAPPGNYTAIIMFVIDTLGTVTDVRIQNDPGFGAGQDAALTIGISPKWLPATQNGRKVKYQQRQSITYNVSEEKQ